MNNPIVFPLIIHVYSSDVSNWTSVDVSRDRRARRQWKREVHTCHADCSHDRCLALPSHLLIQSLQCSRIHFTHHHDEAVGKEIARRDHYFNRPSQLTVCHITLTRVTCPLRQEFQRAQCRLMMSVCHRCPSQVTTSTTNTLAMMAPQVCIGHHDTKLVTERGSVGSPVEFQYRVSGLGLGV